MVKVNLLPPKERTKKQVIKENVMAIFLSILALSIVAVFNISLFLLEKSVSDKIKNIGSDILLQQEKNNKYKDVEKIVEDLNKNIERVTTLNKQNPKWSAVLSEIASKTPIDVSLTEISASASVTPSSAQKTDNKNQPIIMNIKGLVKEQYPIAKYKEALTSLGIFDYVDFDSSKWNQEKEKYEFILILKLKNG